MTQKEKRIFQFLFLASAITVVAGMFVPVMEVDAAQYASISKQMWQEGSFLKIYHRELNYLDKPPLLFWTSAISMGIFGFTDFAYKLPSVLFSLMAIYAIFKLTRNYYGERTAYWASLIYCSSVGFFILNNDIRTDTLLINFTVFSVYQLDEYRRKGSWLSFALAFLSIGLAMLSKGPLGFIFPFLAIFPDAALKRQWRFIFNWKWIFGLLIAAVVISPMVYGLYQQFDADPEAWVNGRKGVSGLRFYFWTQSFGRLTGDSIWATAYSNNPGPFFLTGSFLWAFLPWTPLYLFGFVLTCTKLFKRKFKLKVDEESLTLWAFILPLLALSKSGYQLNHYIYIVIPFTAIKAADVLTSWQGRSTVPRKVWYWFIGIFLVALLLIIVFLGTNVFPSFWAIPYFIMALASLFLIRKFNQTPSFSLAAMGITAFAMMNLFFYPRLLKYQGSHALLDAYEEYQEPGTGLFFYKTGVSHAADFYHEKWIPWFNPYFFNEVNQHPIPIVYTNDRGIKGLGEAYDIEMLDTFQYYPVTRLNLRFMDPSKRDSLVRKRYLIRVSHRPITH